MKKYIRAASTTEYEIEDISGVDLAALEKHIYDKLRELSFYCDDLSVERDDDKIIIKITVNDGDWKHEHRRLDYLMSDIIYEYSPALYNKMYKCDEIVTDDSDGDTYSAIHVYCID